MDLTPIERKLLVEALEIAEKYHEECSHDESRAAVRNLRSRLIADPYLVISYRHIKKHDPKTW